MTVAAAQMAAFFSEVRQFQEVWTICDANGFPSPKDALGQRSMPFWSKQSRAQRIIDTVEAYYGFKTHRLTLEVFQERWLSGLEKDNCCVGLNWSGVRAVGYDLTVDEVRARLEMPD